MSDSRQKIDAASAWLTVAERFLSLFMLNCGSEASNPVLGDATAGDGVFAEASGQTADAFADSPETVSSPCLYIPPEETGLKINEILYDPVGADAGLEWVELFNKSPEPQNVGGFTLTNREAVPLATLPDWTMPPCSYLAVHFGHGTNDDTFINGAAHFFNGPAAEPFDNSRDEAALYSGEPSTETIEDFVAYSDAGEIAEGHAFNHAKTAGIWQAGDFFDTSGAAQKDTTLTPVFVAEGDSIGRDRYSTDTNASADWHALGGIDSFGITLGAENFISPPVVLSIQDEIKKKKKKEWALLIYMAGDNDLEKFGYYKDINDMEKAGSGKNVHVVVYADFATMDMDPKPKEQSTSALIYVKKDKNWNTSQGEDIVSEVQLIDEPNTGDPSYLPNFLKLATEKFPANRYYLIIWGHSNGWKGLAVDFFDRLELEKGHNDRLTMNELRDALFDGPDISVLGFQSCMMGSIEVALQIREKVRYMIASQESVWATNQGTWPWSLIIEKMETDPGTSAKKLAIDSATAIGDKYAAIEKANAKFQDWTFSALNLNGSNFTNLISTVSQFAKELTDGLEDYGEAKSVHDVVDDNVQRRIKDIIKGGTGSVESFSRIFTAAFPQYRSDYRDLHGLADKIEHDDKIAPQWKTNAEKVKEFVEKVVIANFSGKGHPDAKGLSIYFPRAHTPLEWVAISANDPASFDTPLSPDHKDQMIYAPDTDATAAKDHPLPPVPNFRFVSETLWDEFVHRYYNPVADASCVRKDAPANEAGKSECTEKVKKTLTLRAKGSSDSDGKIAKYYWDFDMLKGKNNGQDYDKDKDDEADDDKDKEGITVDYTCPDIPGKYKIRLMVWDDHSEHHTEHFQTDDEFVTINCEK
ncbi:MAG: lamin tail domain-containing protein [Deltaproteobacteria bacterium]|nr:lamin tail domain-containing protein [Deltaproteobacteria bacterium]